MKAGTEVEKFTSIFKKFIVTDSNANHVLCHNKIEGLEPIQTTGDGNYFNNSVSLGLFGSEKHSIFSDLRLLCI